MCLCKAPSGLCWGVNAAGARGASRRHGQAAPAARARYNQPLDFVSRGVVDPYQVDRAVITPALCPVPDLARRLSATDAPGSSSSGGPSLATPASGGRGMLAEAAGREEGEVERRMEEMVLRGSAQDAAESSMSAELDLMAADMGRAGLGCSGRQEQHMAAEGCIQYTVLESMQLGSSPGATQPMDVCLPCSAEQGPGPSPASCLFPVTRTRHAACSQNLLTVSALCRRHSTASWAACRAPGGGQPRDACSHDHWAWLWHDQHQTVSQRAW